MSTFWKKFINVAIAILSVVGVTIKIHRYCEKAYERINKSSSSDDEMHICLSYEDIENQECGTVI